ncbi:MAG: EAL domain-containing protein [Aquificaceae bacterium]|nr:EAL domain-containing protein [Aquificaceae bacterium]
MYLIYTEEHGDLILRSLKDAGLSPKTIGKLFLVDGSKSQLLEAISQLPQEVLKRLKISSASEEDFKKPHRLLEIGFKSVDAETFVENSMFENLMKVVGNVETYFHAIVNAKTGKIFGFEALCRAQVPVYKLFKVSDRIAMITDYFCREKALLEYNSRFSQVHHLFLNMHPKFFNDPLEHVGELEASFQLKGIAPHMVVLEINEYEGMNLNALKMIREFLKNTGVKMALDDVGAGYAGLYQLVEISPDIAKFDMELIRNVHENTMKGIILKKLVEACKDSGIITLAEGVEKREELDFLLNIGVELLQGFIFAKPDPYPNIKEIEKRAYNLLGIK